MIRDVDTVQDVVVDLLRQARELPGDRDWLLGDAERLAGAVTSIPQRTLARRTGRSGPAIRRLVQAGVLTPVRGGRVDAYDAALVEIALADVPAGRRSLARHVAAFADWLSEHRDPAFKRGIEQAREGALEPLQVAASIPDENALLEMLERAERTSAKSVTARRGSRGSAVAGRGVPSQRRSGPAAPQGAARRTSTTGNPTSD